MKRKFPTEKRRQQPKKKAEKSETSSKQEMEKEEVIATPEENLQQLMQSLKSCRKVLKSIIKSDSQHDSSSKVELDVDGQESWTAENVDEEEVDEDNKEVENEDEDYDENSDNESETGSEILVENSCNDADPFKRHFELDLPEKAVEELEKNGVTYEKTILKDGFYSQEDSVLEGDISSQLSNNLCPSVTYNKMFEDGFVKESVVKNWKEVNKIKKKKAEMFTDVQKKLYPIIASYKDLFFFEESHYNVEDIRKLYVMHAVNHILRTRSRILKNNARLAQAEKDNKTIEDCRDQGLTRPKVLILLPFKNSCLQVVNYIMKLVFSPGTKGQVMQRKRLVKEFSLGEDEKESKADRPDDFKAMFDGNIDDCFRLGIAISKNTIKLFTQFYSSDIIIASPLGLRTIIGTEGDKKQDFDFLSSIEVLIADQTDVFLMQNWEHFTHIFEHLHRMPKDSHDTDFSRVRMWSVNQWSKYYRQTLCFSSIKCPEINNIFNKFCYNFNGKTKVCSEETSGSVEQIASQIPQVFQKIPCSSYTELADSRFNYFINKILPDFRGQLSSNTAIFVTSYFDFVRLRNYFKKEEISFIQISEYSKRSNISRARSMFHEQRRHFLLFTERFNFFYRYRIRGIKHIIFYDLPHYPNFYPEIMNYLDYGSASSSTASSCTVLYSHFDGYKLEAIVGSHRCRQLLSSKKDVHMIVNNG